MYKGILKALHERIGRLAKDRFAITAAAATERDAKDIATPTFTGSIHHRRASAEINLGLLARLTFHPPHG